MDMLVNETQPLGGKGGSDSAPLTWWNVVLAASMLLVTVGISFAMKLRLEKQIIVASVRCVVQLTVLGLILRHVFATQNPIYVFGMAGVLGGLAALEVAQWRSKRTIKGMFWIAFFPIFGSAITVGLIGASYAMNFDPPYTASKFIPILGMLLGNTMVGVALGMDSVLASLDSRRDVVEAMLCYGASRWEVVHPIVVEAMRTSLIPTITMVGITGLISIPGMMSGQILGGADVMDAARYQQVIMFMIAASTALGVVIAAITVAFVVVDKEPKLRPERISVRSVAKAANGSASGKNGKGGFRLREANRRTKSWKDWKNARVARLI
ncbi:hypothetical protein GQ54DRAFT_298694 [Martensiomyces pterosporus]|nr:hypothetical protein GQ54DRAFT_298694 [Martensiomyces pterosporus]